MNEFACSSCRDGSKVNRLGHNLIFDFFEIVEEARLVPGWMSGRSIIDLHQTTRSLNLRESAFLEQIKLNFEFEDQQILAI